MLEEKDVPATYCFWYIYIYITIIIIITGSIQTNRGQILKFFCLNSNIYDIFLIEDLKLS